MVGRRAIVPAGTNYAAAPFGLGKNASALDKISARKVVRRAQSKVNQRRYRAEQREAYESLEGQVAELNNQVARYEGQVDALRSAVRLREPELKMTIEYFKIFHDGYQLGSPATAQMQRDFLSRTMKQDLIFMGERCLDKLFTQWSLYHTLFHSFRMECPHMELVRSEPTTMVSAPAQLYLRISRVTIEALYPHILQSEALVQRMIGKELRLPVLCQFYFDEHGIVTQFDTTADTTVGLTEILHSLQDTLQVLDGVRITTHAELQAAPAHVK
ncbi:hypothetical protein ACHHYP_11155 [Achlya hypogyna]|uniref:Bzip transcription factor n=1 Tax=Achlya hypogyna TaxID=1202772 RepID=A0A1V9YJN6_ACHHY|nr:hypothetical protein ACHHYP_11155 [Achlya hypogyna]